MIIIPGYYLRRGPETELLVRMAAEFAGDDFVVEADVAVAVGGGGIGHEALD